MQRGQLYATPCDLSLRTGVARAAPRRNSDLKAPFGKAYIYMAHAETHNTPHKGADG